MSPTPRYFVRILAVLVTGAALVHVFAPPAPACAPGAGDGCRVPADWLSLRDD